MIRRPLGSVVKPLARATSPLRAAFLVLRGRRITLDNGVYEFTT